MAEQNAQSSAAGGQGAEEALEWDKLVRKGMEKLLPQKVTDDTIVQRLAAAGLEFNYANAIALSLVDKAAGGDLSAAKFVREMMGKSPKDNPPPDALDRPLRELDLSRLSDEQLEQLADRLEEDVGP